LGFQSIWQGFEVSNTHRILLETQQVSIRFGGLKAVDQVSLALREGMVTTLVGPNGAGKTTLFNLITGQLQADSGNVLWLGESILGQAQWRIAQAGIGRTFQDLKLFNQMTVLENALAVTEQGSWLWQMGGRKGAQERLERAEHALEQVGLADLRDSRAIDLAYAERKFLSMARILSSGAKLWLLDEPASGLDPRSYERFLSLLRQQVKQGITICIIEHNLDIVKGISDRIAFLDQGRLLAEGAPEDILADASLAAIYFGERAE
jgi:ABC-type branched-subunit amino acid transport system ATPase component